MTSFVRFHEYNDHEGERWNWWLQVDDNEEELVKLRELLARAQVICKYDLWYELTDDIEAERNVNLLCRYADESGNYNPAHNKVTGKFTCPVADAPDAEELDDYFYKGDIRKWFTR